MRAGNVSSETKKLTALSLRAVAIIAVTARRVWRLGSNVSGESGTPYSRRETLNGVLDKPPLPSHPPFDAEQ